MQMRKGDLLLPGAYCFTDSTQEALQCQASYSFKSCPRPKNYTLGIRDKVGRGWEGDKRRGTRGGVVGEMRWGGAEKGVLSAFMYLLIMQFYLTF